MGSGINFEFSKNGSSNSSNFPVLMLAMSNVDLLVVGQTSFSIGGTADKFVTEVIVRLTDLNGFVNVGDVSLGITAPNYDDVFTLTPLTGLNSKDLYFTLRTNNSSKAIIKSTDTLRFNVVNPYVAASALADIYVMGFEV